MLMYFQYHVNMCVFEFKISFSLFTNECLLIIIYTIQYLFIVSHSIAVIVLRHTTFIQ